jgi:hypothetical protein
MSWFPKARSAESVAREIYNGLRDGTVVLDVEGEHPPIVPADAIAQLENNLMERLDLLKKRAKLSEAKDRDVPCVSPLDVQVELENAFDQFQNQRMQVPSVM